MSWCVLKKRVVKSDGDLWCSIVAMDSPVEGGNVSQGGASSNELEITGRNWQQQANAYCKLIFLVASVM